MRETIRCCISCILPSGALDVVRIVHVSGRVEEISGTVIAGDIMQANPKHVLREPPSAASSLDSSGGAGEPPRALTLPPDAELRRDKIYFLVPASSLPRPCSLAAASRGASRPSLSPESRGQVVDGRMGGIAYGDGEEGKEKEKEKGR